MGNVIMYGNFKLHLNIHLRNGKGMGYESYFTMKKEPNKLTLPVLDSYTCNWDNLNLSTIYILDPRLKSLKFCEETFS